MDSRAFRRFRRNKGALAGLVLVILVTVLGIAGPWFAPYDPVEQFTETLLLDNGLPAGPRVVPGHWLGGDDLAFEIAPLYAMEFGGIHPGDHGAPAG